MTTRPTIASDVRPGKMVIITSYFTGETYGLLGPQAAASIITRQTPYECLVVAVTNEDEPRTVKKALYEYFGSQTPLVGFSYLSGRPDLLALAAKLKTEGATTLLAGPKPMSISGVKSVATDTPTASRAWPTISVLHCTARPSSSYRSCSLNLRPPSRISPAHSIWMKTDRV